MANLVILPGRIERIFAACSGLDNRFTLKKGDKERKIMRFLQNEPFLASKSDHSFCHNIAGESGDTQIITK